MKQLMSAFFSIFLLAAALVAAPTQSSHWLHFEVDEAEDGSHVRVNLPLSAIEAALPLIPEEHFRDGRIQIDAGHEIDVAQLREIWRAIRDVPEATTLVRVEDRNENVEITRKGDHLLIQVESHGSNGEDVEVRLPFQVVEALLSGSGEELDLLAGLKALAEYGDGELIAVNGDRETVRVWIDQSAESR